MMAGQQITPTLRLVRPLGQGAMGSVWVADHLALNTQVAVKFMMPAAARDPELVARFRREATAAAQIKSPHVAQVFDHGVAADGSLYIVMELLEGEDLKRRLARLGPLPPREVARIITQTARALGRAHQLGIVHRDIKPDNLFLLDLDGEPFVKVLDFGIAKQAPRGDMGMTSTGSLLGTPFYMSPEQLLSSKHVDAHADLWALGVVGYQALTGKLPFTGETLGALAVAVNSGVLTRPSQMRPELPWAVDEWAARALRRESASRFASVKEMAEALELATQAVESERSAPEAPQNLPPTAGETAGEAVKTQLLARSGPDGSAEGGPPPRSSSGLLGQTLQGATSTGARRPTRRGPLVGGVIALAAMTALGVALVGTSGGTSHRETTVHGGPPSMQAMGWTTPSAAVSSSLSAPAHVEAPVTAPEVVSSVGITRPVSPSSSSGQIGAGAGRRKSGESTGLVIPRPAAAGNEATGQGGPRTRRGAEDADDVGF